MIVIFGSERERERERERESREEGVRNRPTVVGGEEVEKVVGERNVFTRYVRIYLRGAGVIRLNYLV